MDEISLLRFENAILRRSAHTCTSCINWNKLHWDPPCDTCKYARRGGEVNSYQFDLERMLSSHFATEALQLGLVDIPSPKQGQSLES